MKLISIFLVLFVLVNQSILAQNQKAQIVFDENNNKTHLINLLIKDTLTINQKWEEVKKIKKKFAVNHHFIGLKNSNDDFIEIAIIMKSKTQYYPDYSKDEDLLKSSREFESYRNKANYNSFNFLKSDNKTYYSFFIENEKILKTTLIGIIEEYYVEINYYPNSENEPGEVDKLIELFQSIKLN